MTVSANVYIQIPWQYTSFAVWRAKIRVLAIAAPCETTEISPMVLNRRHSEIPREWWQAHDPQAM